MTLVWERITIDSKRVSQILSEAADYCEDFELRETLDHLALRHHEPVTLHELREPTK